MKIVGAEEIDEEGKRETSLNLRGCCFVVGVVVVSRSFVVVAMVNLNH